MFHQVQKSLSLVGHNLSHYTVEAEEINITQIASRSQSSISLCSMLFRWSGHSSGPFRSIHPHRRRTCSPFSPFRLVAAGIYVSEGSFDRIFFVLANIRNPNSMKSFSNEYSSVLLTWNAFPSLALADNHELPQTDFKSRCESSSPLRWVGRNLPTNSRTKSDTVSEARSILILLRRSISVELIFIVITHCFHQRFVLIKSY